MKVLRFKEIFLSQLKVGSTWVIGAMLIALLGFQVALAEVNLNMIGFPKALDCGPEREMVSLNFYSPPDLEDSFKAEGFTLPFKGKFGLDFSGNSVYVGVRMDVCWNTQDDSFILQRVFKRTPTAGFAFSFLSDQMIPDQFLPDAELKKLIFNEPDLDLHLAFVNKLTPTKSYLMKSHGLLNGRPVITLSMYDSGLGTASDPLKPPMIGDVHGTVRVGQVFHGDPWETKKFTSVSRVFEVDKDGEKVKISFEFDYRGDVGEYIDYKLKFAKVEDAHGGNLTYSLVSICQVIGGEPPPACWTINLTHHGLMDSFNFIFDKVTYVLGNEQFEIIRKLASGAEEKKVISVDNCNSLAVCGVGI